MKNKRVMAMIMVCVLIGLLAGCGQKESGVIKVASKPMAEQYILTEILKLMIEQDTDYTVEITKGIGGGTTNIHPALMNGEFDLYPEYTGTAWVTVLKNEEIPDEDTLYQNLVKEYAELGLHFTGLYGFSNSYALAVRSEIAEQYNLSTYSDLAAVSDEIVFGGNYDYIEREDGYPLLCSTYDMEFKDTVGMDIALKYQALGQKEIDVTNAFTTDAMLSVADVKVLKDDKDFFTTYYGGTVVRKDTLEKYPELETVLEKLTGQISEEEMQAMNYELEVNERDEADIAEEFLRSKGLLD